MDEINYGFTIDVGRYVVHFLNFHDFLIFRNILSEFLKTHDINDKFLEDLILVCVKASDCITLTVK